MYEQKHFGKTLRAQADDPFEKASPFELQYIRAQEDYQSEESYDSALFIFLQQSKVLRQLQLWLK